MSQAYGSQVYVNGKLIGQPPPPAYVVANLEAIQESSVQPQGSGAAPVLGYGRGRVRRNERERKFDPRKLNSD